MPLTQQWVLSSQQFVNWGCFEGWWKTTYPGAGHVTIISGETGAGKSTLLDANTVLMQPSRKRLNRASNAATKGRARGEDERNIVSYMRGKLDRSREGGDEIAIVLREGSVWSAIAQTWHNADGSVFTALVAYFARPDDRTTPSIKRFGHVDAEFDLRDLEPYTQGQHLANPLSTRAIRRDHPRIDFKDNQPSLHRALWQHLGIGADGDGARAMELLHRVQSSDGIDSVNDLFTQLVLDEPATFARAADAVAHFARLKSSHEKVATIEDQVERLTPIPGLWDTYRENSADTQFYRSLGAVPDRDGTTLTPFWKWARTREHDLLDIQELQLSTDHRSAKRAADTAAGEVERIEKRLSDNAAKRYAQGGALLDSLDSAIRHAETERQRADEARVNLQVMCEEFFALPGSAEEHNAQVEAAQAFLDDYDSKRQDAATALEQIQQTGWPMMERRKALQREQAHFTGRGDLLNATLTRIRQRYVELTGIPEQDLCFIAELLDMDQPYEQWRTAAELTLGGFATTLLIPSERAADFRALTDSELTERRIQSITVPVDPRPICNRDPATLAGRFILRDHRFAGWLSDELHRRFDHVCVDDGAALSHLPDGARGVTKAGQVRDGRRGSHGGQLHHRRIIGFSPKAQLDEIAAELADIDERLTSEVQRATDAQARKDQLDRAQIAHSAFLRTSWEQLDTQRHAAEIIELTDQREAALSDKALATLNAERFELNTAATDAREVRDRNAKAARDIDDVRDRLQKYKDRVWNHIVLLDPVQEPDMARLDALISDHLGHPPTTADVRNMVPFTKFLAATATAVESKSQAARQQLTTIFANFLSAYGTSEADLGEDPDMFYDAFKAILDGHLASGVEDVQQEFAEYTATFSGLEIMNLSTAYQNELETIGKRLDQINQILTDQPYGADGRERISIVPRSGGTPDAAVAFLKTLNMLTSHSTRGLTYDEALERFASFQQVIDQIADPDRAKPLLDVRSHVRLEAQRRDESGNLVAIHDTLADKSGGEMQELTMFIVAAAIRYQVGSLTDDTPRFAPVFLDEGMVKADPAATQRAVNVWKRLGFQPIIAVPLDKHESVMPTATACWAVAKDAAGRSRLDLMMDATHSIAGAL